MKILFIHNFYQQFGGEDSAAKAERELLESCGHEVLAYTRHNDDINKFSVWEKLKFIPSTLYSLRTRQEIRDTVNRFHPDVAFVHNIYPLISPALYHTLHHLGVPIVQVVHDFRPYCSNGWFFTNGQICERCKFGNYLHGITNRCYKDSYTLSALYSATLGINRAAGVTDKIDAFVCLTEFYKQKLLEVGIPEHKIHIRPNFIKRDAFVTPPSPGRGNYALFLGRLSREKGPWTVVRAFEGLKDVELRIAGTGPLEAELSRYVSDRKLKHIRLVGFKSGADKWQLIRDSLFTIVPSECYENFPVVVLEFFSSAKAVIASNLGGLPHIVEHGRNGLLYKPGDAVDLGHKIRTLLACPEDVERMGRHGRHLVETRYSPQQSHATLMKIFQHVQAHRSQNP